MPTYSPSPGPKSAPGTPRGVTEVVPFSLSGEGRAAAMEEARVREAEKLEEEERAARAFKARKMPVGEAWAPQLAEVRDLPLHHIAIANIVCCMAYKRAVAGGSVHSAIAAQ